MSLEEMTPDETKDAMRSALHKFDERCAQAVSQLTAAANALDIARAHIPEAVKGFEADDIPRGTDHLLQIAGPAGAACEVCQETSDELLGLLVALLIEAPLDEDTLIAAMGSEADLQAAREALAATSDEGER
jgi:hypothetical protein